MKRWRRPSPELFAALLLASAAGPVLGCVTSGAHEEVVQERDQLLVARRDLEEEVRLLKIANQSLDDHVAKLVNEREELLENRDSLTTRLKSTLEAEAELSSTLRSREEELAVTAAALVAQSKRVDEMQGAYDGLVSDLQAEVEQGQILISQLGEGLRVNVSQDILFPSGSAVLSAEGRKVLSSVAARLKELDYDVAVEGHSDNMPIRGGLAKRYPTNWELAGARAASVVRLFVKRGIPADRLTAVSHGDAQPVVSNDTAEGRARNRRIEIRLRPVGADDEAPAAAGAARKAS